MVSSYFFTVIRYVEALEDIRKSVQLDPNFVKGYTRMAKCGIALGDLTTAEYAIKKVQSLQPDGQGKYHFLM